MYLVIIDKDMLMLEAAMSKVRAQLFFPINPTDKDEIASGKYGDRIVECIYDNLINHRYKIAMSIINDDRYFKPIWHCVKELDLDMTYKNWHDDYNKSNFNEKNILKVSDLLLKLPRNINQCDEALRASYTQALIRWFHTCFGKSRYLEMVSRGLPLPCDVKKYVSFVLKTNILARTYIEHILFFDKNLAESKKTDDFLLSNGIKPYIFQLFNDASKCLEKFFIENDESEFIFFGGFNPIEDLTHSKEPLGLFAQFKQRANIITPCDVVTASLGILAVAASSYPKQTM